MLTLLLFLSVLPAIHLLFINLLTDSLPAIAIGMEPSDDSLLKEKPRNPKEGILTKYFIIKIILQGALIGIATMSAYYIGLKTNTALATSTLQTLTSVNSSPNSSIIGETI